MASPYLWASLQERRIDVTFNGLEALPDGSLELRFAHDGVATTVRMEPEAEAVAGGARKAQGALELGADVPGELLRYSLAEGEPLAVSADCEYDLGAS